MRFANDAPTRLHFVDGLRGLAVLSVVGFHVHLPHMGGGFTGVDMFFVISGFVITIQLIRNLEAGTFSFWKFYYQRFLRIIPPLVVVCLCTILLAPFFPFLPKELARLDYTAVAALTMVVNYYLAGKNGYFETSSQNNPLLHTWSLGVEEQYYAFAPAILLLLFYLCKRRGFGFPRALLILSLVAIAISLGLAALWPSERFAFYAVWTRAWQFGAGGLAAVIAMRPVATSRPLQSIVQAGALVLLCGAIAISRGDNPFPSLTVIVVTAMTAIILISGIAASGPVAAALASRPLRAIGLVSYAWYLWHWPFITFARSTNLMQDDLLRDGSAALLALLAAVPTYYLVEAPLRRLRRQMPGWLKPKPVLLAGSAALLLIAAAIVPTADRADADLVAMPPSPGFTACRPFKPDTPVRETAPCLIGESDKPSVLVWGDSAAWAFLHIADTFTKGTGRSALVIATPACLPLADGHPIQSRRCNNANREAAAIIDDPSLHFDSLILAARWAFYSGQPTAARGDLAPRLKLDAPFDMTLRNELGRLIEHAHAAHVGRTLLVGPWPDFEQPVTDCLWRAERTGHDREQCAVSRANFVARNSAIIAALKDSATSYANVRTIDATDVMCSSVLCLPFDGSMPLYSDDFHLTIAGADRFSQGFAGDLAWAFGDAKAARSGEAAPAN